MVNLTQASRELWFIRLKRTFLGSYRISRRHTVQKLRAPAEFRGKYRFLFSVRGFKTSTLPSGPNREEEPVLLGLFVTDRRTLPEAPTCTLPPDEP